MLLFAEVSACIEVMSSNAELLLFSGSILQVVRILHLLE